MASVKACLQFPPLESRSSVEDVLARKGESGEIQKKVGQGNEGGVLGAERLGLHRGSDSQEAKHSLARITSGDAFEAPLGEEFADLSRKSSESSEAHMVRRDSPHPKTLKKMVKEKTH